MIGSVNGQMVSVLSAQHGHGISSLALLCYGASAGCSITLKNTRQARLRGTPIPLPTNSDRTFGSVRQQHKHKRNNKQVRMRIS